MRLALSAVLIALIAGVVGLEADDRFPVRAAERSVPVVGRDAEAVERVAETVDWVLGQADPAVAEGLTRQGVSLYVIDNEEELERDPELLEFLLEARPLELIYTDIDGTDETLPENRGTVAQKLMQLFVYYPLELDPKYTDLATELEAAFETAIRTRPEIGGRPVYDPEDYSNPDEAHPHMKPPHYTALGAYLGLGYEVHFGLSRPARGQTEYYPVSPEEMARLDPALVEFLNRHMNNALKETQP